VENGNPTERRKWFPDIEPLFKLLSYENVPPYLKVQDLFDSSIRVNLPSFSFIVFRLWVVVVMFNDM
jgi:hypothetical protein